MGHILREGWAQGAGRVPYLGDPGVYSEDREGGDTEGSEVCQTQRRGLGPNPATALGSEADPKTLQDLQGKVAGKGHIHKAAPSPHLSPC